MPVLCQDLKNLQLATLRGGCQSIQCCFVVMASKWRCFKTELELSAEKVDVIAKVCTMLHNLVTKEGTFQEILQQNLILSVVGLGVSARSTNSPAIRLEEPPEDT